MPRRVRLDASEHEDGRARVDGILPDGQRRDAVGVYLRSEVSAVIESHDTLCVLCQHSCRRGCSWDDKLIQVKGWTAEVGAAGYHVIRCPEFKKETPETILPKEFDNGGLVALLEAVAARMRDDYIRGKGPHDRMSERKKHGHTTYAEIRMANRKEIEKWLLRGQGRKLLQLSDPESVIQMLRGLARKYEAGLASGLRWEE